MSNTKNLKISKVEYNSTGSIRFKINEFDDGSIEEIKFSDANPRVIEYKKTFDEDKLKTSLLCYNNNFIEIHYSYNESGRLIFANITKDTLFEKDIYEITCDYADKSKIVRKLFINGDFIGKEVTHISKMEECLHIFTNKRFGSFKEHIMYDKNGDIISIDLEPIRENYKLSSSSDNVIIG